MAIFSLLTNTHAPLLIASIVFVACICLLPILILVKIYLLIELRRVQGKVKRTPSLYNYFQAYIYTYSRVIWLVPFLMRRNEQHFRAVRVINQINAVTVVMYMMIVVVSTMIVLQYPVP